MTQPLPAPNVLLEQGAVIVVNKPGGLLTQGPPGIDSLELRVKNWLKVRDSKPGKVYLGVPHRLDRPVSGVMVVVKNVRAAKRISEQIRNREVKKIYWTVVQGHLDADRGRWEDWMRKIPDQAKSEIVPENHDDAKNAILDFEVLQRIEVNGQPMTWLKIELHTGRTHQIRLQTSRRDHPIIGDTLYGSAIPFGPQTEDLRSRWIALHARELGFIHPIDKTPVDQIAPLPSHWDCFDLNAKE
jgi:23S rRNA pseudouridine1911/1915/1917 synthase